jgi:manganese transport protein
MEANLMSSAEAPVKPKKYRQYAVMESLPEVHGTIATDGIGFWRKLFSFAGPGYLVAVGYMDPGNWATSIAGGSAFGYTLLTVILMSNIMAILLQALTVRLGIASGRDLAQSQADQFSMPVRYALWLLAEGAIIATDLAEVIGSAIAINLLFGFPLPVGVALTALDVFLVLYLQGKGFRKLEALVVALTLVIAICFGFEMLYSQPIWGDVLNGYIPKTDIWTNPDMLYISLGIIGAVVMPHNLYLHSSIVQTRKIADTTEGRREAIKFATIDSTIALTLALFVNSAILILAAASFHGDGRPVVAEIQDAHRLLAPTLGADMAPILFAIALLACGLNSAVTATLSGQIVMEGFVNLRLVPWMRRLVTRGIAIIPAMVVTIIYGESGTAQLLVLSQVVLSMALPFTIVPLILATADSKRMRGIPAPIWLTIASSLIATLLIVLNVRFLLDFFGS